MNERGEGEGERDSGEGAGGRESGEGKGGRESGEGAGGWESGEGEEVAARRDFRFIKLANRVSKLASEAISFFIQLDNT